MKLCENKLPIEQGELKSPEVFGKESVDLP